MCAEGVQRCSNSWLLLKHVNKVAALFCTLSVAPLFSAKSKGDLV